MTPAPAGAQYRVPPEPSRWPSIALAVVMHAALLGFLWIGISWQNTEPVAVTAEVWDMKVESAAAPLLPPPPAPEPEPEPEPKPVPKEIPPPPPPRVEQPVAPKTPDIALEREKRKAEQLKQEADKRELIEQKKRDEAKTRDLAEKRKLEEDKKAKEAEKKEAEKKEADKKKADKLAADKKKADQQAKASEAKAAAAEQAKLDKLRDAEMKRLMGAAGTSGSAAKSTAPRNDASYQAALTAKIKSTTTYAGSTEVPGNPRAEFRIEQLPTGEIISVRKVKSSGVPSFDEAVEKGIIKSSPLPKKKDGTVERSVLIGFSMKDLD
jgi:colicin import membrane protein